MRPEWIECSLSHTPEVAGVAGSETCDEQRTVRELLLALAAQAEVWVVPTEQAYARIPVNGHYENVPVRSRAFERWLSHRYYCITNKAVGSASLRDALTTVEARAFYGDARRESVHIRVALYAGKLYLDLCDAAWRVVEIDAEGWRLLSSECCPVRFRRAPGMLPLPEPARGGTLSALRRYMRVSDSDWHLIAAWLVATMRPDVPIPILAVHGEQGSGKSTISELLRSLVDPNVANLRAESRDVRDLMIAANNGYVIAFDNLSHLSPAFSDALCRLATGGGFGVRALYTDDEERIFSALRPVLLNGISELATRSDLLDRTIIIWLDALSESDRCDRSRLLAAWEQDRPFILGALLDRVSTALRHLPYVSISRLPRMADFALWAIAAEGGTDERSSEFWRAYARNRESAHVLAVDASPVASAIVELVNERGNWQGTCSDLLELLVARVHERDEALRSSHALGRALRRYGPNLRALGVFMQFVRVGKKRLVTITKQFPNGGNPVTGSHPLCSRCQTAMSARDGSWECDRCGEFYVPPDTPH